MTLRDRVEKLEELVWKLEKEIRQLKQIYERRNHASYTSTSTA